jgi:hypothetical protein
MNELMCDDGPKRREVPAPVESSEDEVDEDNEDYIQKKINKLCENDAIS